MFYKVSAIKNPINKEMKYYGMARSIGTITSRQIAAELAARSAMTPGDMYDTLDNLRDLITQWLIQGFTVRLDGLGLFRLTIQSEGTDSLEKFTPAKIRRIVVRIIAEKALKENVKNNIHFESVNTLEARLNGHSGKKGDRAAASADGAGTATSDSPVAGESSPASASPIAPAGEVPKAGLASAK